MKDFQTRAKPQSKMIYSWFFLIILMLILGMFVRSAYASFTKKQTADIQKEKYQDERKTLQEKKESLERKIQNLKSDRGLEEELRKRFNVVKEGETLIRIIDEQ